MTEKDTKESRFYCTANPELYLTVEKRKLPFFTVTNPSHEEVCPEGVRGFWVQLTKEDALQLAKEIQETYGS